MLKCHFRYLMDLIGKCGVEVTIGLVQTAYANGASTDYIQNVLVSVNPCHWLRTLINVFIFIIPQKVPVATTSTGVKHLHHKATEFDIGIYFEANGHGTVVFSNKARKAIHTASKNVEYVES